MKSRFGSLSFLLVVFIGLTAVYWFGFKDRTPPSQDEPFATRESVALISVDPTEVQEISWSYQATKGKISRVSDTQWKLVEPSIIADGALLSEFALSALNVKGENKYPFAQVTKVESGIESPTLTIVVLTKDNKSEKVIIGKETVDREFYYATKEGLDYSTLVSSYVVDSLKKDPYTLVAAPSPSVSTLGN